MVCTVYTTFQAYNILKQLILAQTLYIFAVIATSCNYDSNRWIIHLINWKQCVLCQRDLITDSRINGNLNLFIVVWDIVLFQSFILSCYALLSIPPPFIVCCNLSWYLFKTLWSIWQSVKMIQVKIWSNLYYQRVILPMERNVGETWK